MQQFHTVEIICNFTVFSNPAVFLNPSSDNNTLESWNQAAGVCLLAAVNVVNQMPVGLLC